MPTAEQIIAANEAAALDDKALASRLNRLAQHPGWIVADPVGNAALLAEAARRIAG